MGDWEISRHEMAFRHRWVRCQWCGQWVSVYAPRGFLPRPGVVPRFGFGEWVCYERHPDGDLGWRDVREAVVLAASWWLPPAGSFHLTEVLGSVEASWRYVLRINVRIQYRRATLRRWEEELRPTTRDQDPDMVVFDVPGG